MCGRLRVGKVFLIGDAQFVEAAKLEMLRAGVSRYEPDPLTALVAAKGKAR
jgi:hypothetical protein